MKRPTVIYILGLPATGKSTLAKKLSVELNLPLISKDELKIILFDVYGWAGREESMQAGRVSYDIIDYILEEQLRVGNTLIVESTPPKFAADKFKGWQVKYGARYVQIYCDAEANIIRERFKARILADERHVSGVEGKAGLKNLEALISQGFVPIDVEGEIIKIDTTDFARFDQDALTSHLRGLLA
jgi:predicted kinase